MFTGAGCDQPKGRLPGCGKQCLKCSEPMPTGSSDTNSPRGAQILSEAARRDSNPHETLVHEEGCFCLLHERRAWSGLLIVLSVGGLDCCYLCAGPYRAGLRTPIDPVDVVGLEQCSIEDYLYLQVSCASPRSNDQSCQSQVSQ